MRKRIGDGFRIIDDAEVALTSKGDSRLPIPLRRIRVKRDKGATITLITNDLKRTAVEIAALYKSRWQIELLFRWIKQHLDIRTFLGTNETAIRLQVFAAMIAYLLLRLAARMNCVKMPALRLAELVCQRLFMRKPIAEIDRPPPVNPSKRQPRSLPDQLGSAMRDLLGLSPDRPAPTGRGRHAPSENQEFGSEGAFPQAQTRGKAPSSRPSPARGEKETDVRPGHVRSKRQSLRH